MAQVIPYLLRKTLEYGFEIIGWVILWRPIEILVFEPIALRDNIAALQKLAELRGVLYPLAGISDRHNIVVPILGGSLTFSTMPSGVNSGPEGNLRVAFGPWQSTLTFVPPTSITSTCI